MPDEAGSPEPGKDQPSGRDDRAREAKLRELEAQIRGGRYEVPAIEVADAIIAVYQVAWPEEA